MGCKHHVDDRGFEVGIVQTYLDELVPAGGDNHGVLGVGAESDARNPLSVALLGDGVLAVTEGVPELDCSVARTRDDLSVVGREGDGENVVGVANESSGGGTGSKLPEAESLVPRGRQSVSTIRGDHLNPAKISPRPSSFRERSGERTYTVGDDVRVTLERSLGVTVLGLVAGEVPDDESLVSGARQEHVGAEARSVSERVHRATRCARRSRHTSPSRWPSW